MWKKVLGFVVIIAAAVGLVVYGMDGNTKNVAVSDSGSVSEASYYKELKKTPAGQQVLANMIIEKVLAKKFGDDVSQKSIDKQYNKVKKQYGSSFATTLTSNGMTEATFRDSLYLQALEEAAMKGTTKFTNAALKKEYKNYHAKVNISIITTDSESDAKDVIASLKKGKDFATLAKSKSTDTTTKSAGGKMSAFDSTSTTVDSTVQKAAFKLKKGEYTTTPVKVTSSSTGTTTYYVIKMNSLDKKKSFAAMKAKLKNIIVTDKMSDTTTVQAMVGDQLNKAKVTIKDSDLKSILSTYYEAAESAKSSSSSSK